ncbi:MAG: hypothetical protein ACPGD8_04860 [Flavobacteriales bacterium]
MKQFISIDVSTKKGQLLLELLKEFKNSKAVQFLSPAQLEKMEDEILLESMEAGLESGVAEPRDVYQKLNIK